MSPPVAENSNCEMSRSHPLGRMIVDVLESHPIITGEMVPRPKLLRINERAVLNVLGGGESLPYCALLPIANSSLKS